MHSRTEQKLGSRGISVRNIVSLEDRKMPASRNTTSITASKTSERAASASADVKTVDSLEAHPSVGRTSEAVC